MTGVTAMDFELPEELKLLKHTVRTFVDRELIPIEMHAMDGPSLRPDVRATSSARRRTCVSGYSTCPRNMVVRG